MSSMVILYLFSNFVFHFRLVKKTENFVPKQFGKEDSNVVFKISKHKNVVKVGDSYNEKLLKSRPHHDGK